MGRPSSSLGKRLRLNEILSLELLRDVSGLFGAALSAVAFFRFEGRKERGQRRLIPRSPATQT